MIADRYLDPWTPHVRDARKFTSLKDAQAFWDQWKAKWGSRHGIIIRKLD